MYYVYLQLQTDRLGFQPTTNKNAYYAITYRIIAYIVYESRAGEGEEREKVD